LVGLAWIESPLRNFTTFETIRQTRELHHQAFPAATSPARAGAHDAEEDATNADEEELALASLPACPLFLCFSPLLLLSI